MVIDIERKPVKRLDQALTLWEDLCFLINARSKLQIARGLPPTAPMDAPFTTYPDFRRHVLRSAEEGHEFDRAKFLGTDRRIPAVIGPIGSIPESLYGWNKHSRRVFALAEDISGQLANTDLEGILWSDVRFPFKAYAMELKAPLKFSGNDISDFILVNEIRADGREGITLSLLPTYLDHAPYLNYKQKQRLTSLLANRKIRQAERVFEEANSQSTVLTIPHLVLDKSHLDFPVLDTDTITHRLGLRNNTPDERQLLEDATRLVVGLCLYLKQLPVGEKYKSEWAQVPSSPDRTAITNEAQVCYITSTHPLVGMIRENSPEEGTGGYEMSWHQRRGYWSRERGKGNNPVAPKIIWHAPTEVRRDRKPVGDSIPGGAQTNV